MDAILILLIYGFLGCLEPNEISAKLGLLLIAKIFHVLLELILIFIWWRQMQVELLAKKLGMRPEELVKVSIEKYLQDELARVEAQIAEILAKYGVKDPDELKDKIESGDVPEHPAWEDLIDLRNLLETRRRLLEVIKIAKQS